MNWIKSFFEESAGIASMTRLIQSSAFTACIALPITVWAIVSLKSGALSSIDSTISTFCLGAFGTATVGKVVQSIKAE